MSDLVCFLLMLKNIQSKEVQLVCGSGDKDQENNVSNCSSLGFNSWQNAGEAVSACRRNKTGSGFAC